MRWWLAVALCFSLVALLAVTLRRNYLVIRVLGPSMTPTLQPGDRLLVRRTTAAGIRAGIIVVLRDWPDVLSPLPDNFPGLPDNLTLVQAAGGLAEPVQWLIKRLAAVPGDPVPEVARKACGNARVVPPGMMVVLSDNDSGRDSRRWGFVSADQVIGHAVMPLPRSR